MANQPWTPPSGDTWNNVDILFRTGLGREITIPEGDQNNGDFQNAINWLGSRVMELIDSANFQTGDIKPSINTTIQNGWLVCDKRTIGSSASGSQLTGDAYYNLFKTIWVFATNSDLLTSSGGATTKGANADADWGANKRIYLPDLRGRTLGGVGQGTGLPSTRTLGQYFGVEGYNDNHAHSITLSTGAALGVYTPSGTVEVDNYVGNIIPLGTIEIEEYVGSKTVSVADFELKSTPSGTLEVVLANNALGGSVYLAASGATITVLGKSCIGSIGGAEISVIECDSALFVSSNDIAAELVTNNDLVSNVTVTTADFVGIEEDLTHGHPGSTVDIDHSHVGTFTGSNTSITHGHTASFIGDDEDLTHSHLISGNTNVTTITIGCMQPTFFVNYLIRL